MKKPQEQEWKARQTTASVVVGAGDDGPVCTMSKPPAELRLGMEEAHDLMRKRAEFIVAAPDMSRALFLHQQYAENPEGAVTYEQCMDATRVALRKAGVL